METHYVGDTRELYLLKKTPPKSRRTSWAPSSAPLLLFAQPRHDFAFDSCWLYLCSDIVQSYTHQKHHTREEVKENRKRNSCMSNRMEAHKKTD